MSNDKSYTGKPLKELTPEEKKAFLADLKKEVTERLTPEQLEALKEAGAWLFSPDMQERIETFKNNAVALFKSLNDVLPLLVEEMDKDPAIKAELEAMDTMEEALDSPQLQTLFDRVGVRLKEKHPELTEEETTELTEVLPHIVAKELQDIIYPVGKVNNSFWTLFEEAQKNGQIAIAVEKRGSKKPADVLYSINFADLTGVSISKNLTAYDKRVYIAAGALFNAGNEVITVSQIYSAMGNTGRPSSAQVKKINDAITKMSLAHIFISNEPERNVYKNRKKFVYDASLLPMERVSGFINNVYADSAIHLFREPPLITFATERKQITTIPKKLLESPISKTEANLKIDDYLIDRISQMKNKGFKSSNKILFQTIYKNCGINTAKQKQRAADKVKTYLEYYKECGFIKGYRLEKDGIYIQY